MLAHASVAAVCEVLQSFTPLPIPPTPPPPLSKAKNKKPPTPKKIFRVGKQSVRNMKVTDEMKYNILLADARENISKTYAAYPYRISSVCVRVEPTLSKVGSPVKLGIFALDDIAANERILWYGGVIRYKSEIEATHKSHVRDGKSMYVFDGNVYESRLHRPIPTTEAELTQLCSETYEDEVLHLSPFGYLCNTGGCGGNDNVRERYTAVIADKIHRQYNIPYLYATKHIYKGDQLLCHYGNDCVSNAHTDEFVPLDAAATRIARDADDVTKEEHDE